MSWLARSRNSRPCMASSLGRTKTETLILRGRERLCDPLMPFRVSFVEVLGFASHHYKQDVRPAIEVVVRQLQTDINGLHTRKMHRNVFQQALVSPAFAD